MRKKCERRLGTKGVAYYQWLALISISLSKNFSFLHPVLKTLTEGLDTHLFVKVPRPGDSEGTFSVFESSCYLLLPA